MLFGDRPVRRSFPNIGAVDTRWKRISLGSTSKIVFVFMLDLVCPFYITRPLTGLIERICWVHIFRRFLAHEKYPGYNRDGAFPYFETNLWIPRVKSQIRTRDTSKYYFHGNKTPRGLPDRFQWTQLDKTVGKIMPIFLNRACTTVQGRWGRL